MLVPRGGIHKELVRIANREDTDQTDSLWSVSALFLWAFLAGNYRERSGSVVVLDSRLRGRMFQPYRRHCIVALSKTHLS